MSPRSRVVAAVLFALITAFGFATPTSASGQLSPADSASVLLSTASAFEADEDWDVAEALYRFILQHFPGTPAAAQARLRLSGTAEMATGSGATEIQVWSTLYGLWLGVAIPGALNSDDQEAYGVGLLLGGPAGFFAGRSFARSRSLTIGQARAITLGGSWGTWQGFGWRDVFDIGNALVCDEFGCYRSGSTEEETFAAMLVGGLAGITTGALLARKPIANATATAANFGALFGSWMGVASALVLELDHDHENAVMATTLVVGNVGLVAGALAGSRLDWSRSRWRLVSIASVLGGLGGVGIDLLVDPHETPAAVGIPLAASIVGLGFGIYSTRDMLAGGDAGGEGSALLNLTGGDLTLGGLTPIPMVRPVHGPNGSWVTPALGFEIFRAVF